MSARSGRRVSEVKERFWRGHVTRQRATRLTIREYCGEHGLSEPSFYSWRREIARRDRAAPRGAMRGPAAQTDGKADFVRLDVQPSIPTAPSLIEIILPGGVRMLVPTGVTREQLREVLAALNEDSAGVPRPC